MKKVQDYYERAKKRIPGISQLISKRPPEDLFDVWPFYFEKAKGCEVWDLDGNKYIDMLHMSIGTNILGYCDPDVDAAVLKVIHNGNMSSLLAPETVELAEKMCELHPWAEMVRYTKSGGEAAAVAVRIARAATGKDKVLISGYHGWSDWYLAANLGSREALNNHLRPHLEPLGVPKGLEGTAIPFDFNDLNGFKKALEANDGEIAAVIMEPQRSDPPEPGYLEEIRKITKEKSIVLIFDEISIGWRVANGGAHLKFGVDPDIAVFAKAMSNGYPLGTIIGIQPVMEYAAKSFVSSTYWTDRIGPAAALATIEKIIKENVVEHINTVGRQIQEIWKEASESAGLKIEVDGCYPLSKFHFAEGNEPELVSKFTRGMLDRGIIARNMFYPSFAHKAEHVEKYLQASAEAFRNIEKSL